MASPVKLMRQYRYEHWGLVYSLFGMLLLPWIASFALCPGLLSALAEVPLGTLLKANACSFAWGVANILCSLCLLRIGFSLTLGILTGIGLPLGVLIPMMLKGSGSFADAPSPLSPAGLGLLAGAAVMLCAVAAIAVAGFGRDASQSRGGGSFKVGLIMAVAAGLLQMGLSFSFVYAQGPLVDSLRAHGSSWLGANAGVWAAVLPGGALVNVAYPLWLVWRGRSLASLGSSFDFSMSLGMGFMFFVMTLSLGLGMRELGPLGASLGFGLSQGLQIMSSQAVGVLGGEWRGAARKPKLQMASGMAAMMAGVCAMALARGFAS